MNVDALRVRNYRCIADSGWVSMDNLMCLVGKNESGKTAFMRALQNLNPSYDISEYDPYRDYPRERWPEYSDRHEEDPDIVASARLELADEDIEAIEDEFVPDVVADETVVVHRDYTETLRWEIEIDEEACLEYLLSAHEFDEETEAALEDADTLTDLEDDEDRPLDALREELGSAPTDAVAAEIGAAVLESRLPEFRYIGEYSIMEGTIEIESLLERERNDELTPGDQAFLSLLTVAGLDLEEFEAVENWRQTASELEAASADVSETAMDYWSQSGTLRIRLEAASTTDDGTERKALQVRVENREYNVSVEFEQRSRGFRLFFSSFCQLMELRQTTENTVVMLDEPGLNLHARAKQQFLEFMRTELAPSTPIIYTTHSPFMIDAENLHRTKLVMADPIGENNVFTDVSLADDHTRFPLRNVFELELMDTLLVNPHALLVERKADHALLSVVSNILRERNQKGLDTRWTVVPIKEYRNIATFLSLFGQDRLNVAALLQEDPTERRTPGRRDDSSVLDDIPIKLVSEYTSTRGDSTIEDMFSESFYLELVNQTYATALEETGGVPNRIGPDDLSTSKAPIVERLQSYFAEHEINDGEFERAAPALHLQKNADQLADDLDQETRRVFTRLFGRLNNTLESFEGVSQRSSSFLGSLFG